MLRNLSADDDLALLSFLNENLAFDEFSLDLIKENIFDDADYSASLAQVWVEEGEILGFGMGLIRPETKKGYIKFLVVAQNARKKGIGQTLLETLEAQLFRQGANCVRIAESNPNYFMPGVDVRYTEGHIFLAKRGYQKIGETYNLWVDLNVDTWETASEEKQLLSSNDITIRRAVAEDLQPVMDFCKAHFEGWQAEVRNMFRNNPISLHLAFNQEKILGFAGHFGNNLGTPWFGPMGTASNQRKLGIGGILYRRCLKDLRNAGFKGAIIPWVGPYAFYNRYSGAYINRIFWRFEKLPPP